MGELSGQALIMVLLSALHLHRLALSGDGEDVHLGLFTGEQQAGIDIELSRNANENACGNIQLAIFITIVCLYRHFEMICHLLGAYPIKIP